MANFRRNPQSPAGIPVAWGASTLHRCTLYDAIMVPPGEEDGTLGYDPIGRYRRQALHHVERNWNEDGGPIVRGFGHMYHYRVSADGRLWRTQPEELITWHARAANLNGLGICCDLGPSRMPATHPTGGIEGSTRLALLPSPGDSRHEARRMGSWRASQAGKQHYVSWGAALMGASLSREGD